MRPPRATATDHAVGFAERRAIDGEANERREWRTNIDKQSGRSESRWRVRMGESSVVDEEGVSKRETDREKRAKHDRESLRVDQTSQQVTGSKYGTSQVSSLANRNICNFCISLCSCCNGGARLDALMRGPPRIQYVTGTSHRRG